MINFPRSTYIGQNLPKEAFYKQLKLSADIKSKFVSDIQKIVVENSLSNTTLNLNANSVIDEIIVLGITLKKQDYERQILENIARQNKHHLLFCLNYEEQGQLAVYFNKLYLTDWQSLDQMRLETKGFSVEEIWNGYIEQVALIDEHKIIKRDEPIQYRLKNQEERLRLMDRIEKIEKVARVEKQPKKKFEKAMRAQQLKKDLENL